MRRSEDRVRDARSVEAHSVALPERKRCRDSSVGRASGRRSEGPRFDPGSRHLMARRCWRLALPLRDLWAPPRADYNPRTRLLGLLAWFSLRVQEGPGSILGTALLTAAAILAAAHLGGAALISMLWRVGMAAAPAKPPGSTSSSGSEVASWPRQPRFDSWCGHRLGACWVPRWRDPAALSRSRA